MRRLLPLVALALLLFGASAARAESTVAIFSIEISGDGPPELRTQLLKRIEEGIASTGRKVIPLEELLAGLESSPELVGCTSSTCLVRIRDAIGAQQYVRATIEARGAAYSIDLELLEPAHDETVVKRVADSCAVCTIPELNDLVKRAVKSLFDEGAKGKVLIATAPAGAELEIDGEPAGPSPHDGELSVGEHNVVARLEGYADAATEFRVDAEAPVKRVELDLVPLQPEVPERPPARRPFATWKWVAAGAALALVGSGTTLWILDGETCDASDMRCPKVRNSAALGIGLAAGGVALGGVAGWMFVRDRRDQRDTVAAGLSVTSGGALGSLRVRF
jgi:hypothetical protein